ncbi:TKL/TKL-ccin protein kinase [Cristinia sonorae]|uniref:TKL/TKL-ccin protein kinase n=1 Tax=Cristinia sonorae TaxID=1940300 RepID=A0A8K0XUZ1_9AGAR|nr:TKL/TKL-ccin protein kinase [Cristinia sonorae]
MSAFVAPVLGAASFAADVGGVPGLGLAADLLAGIREHCEKVASHKKEAKRMANKAARLIATLEQHEADLEQSQLRDYANDVLHTLRKVNKRMRDISQHKRVFAFFNDPRIAEGIKQCDSDLDAALSSFNISANVLVERSQTEIRAMIESQHQELRTILFSVLRNPANVARMVEMERSGDNVVLPIMNAGQQQLGLVAEELQAQVIAMQPEHGDDHDENDQEPPMDIAYPQSYLETQRGLSKLHMLTGVLPTVKILNGMVKKLDQIPVAGGVFSDVYLGYWLEDQKVALKAMRGIRTRKNNDKSEVAAKIEKRFLDQINLWSGLSHPNILKFLGILTEKHYVHMVSPWQENGNALYYIKNHPDADRLRLVRGAADGLAYLHSEKILHGNLKCTNILVTDEGEACISDFGMSKVVEDVTEQSASAILTNSGSARWLAPELIMTENHPFTLACDTYSFAMTMLECFTEEVPFASLKRDAQVIHRLVTESLNPDRPRGEKVKIWITDDVWMLMKRCWSFTPLNRPLMEEVATRLREFEGEARTQVVEDFMDVDHTG